MYEALAVTRTGSPTWLVPFGKLMQISIGPGTEAVPPSRSSAVFACDRTYSWSVPLPGFLFTAAQRAPSFARCVWSIQ